MDSFMDMLEGIQQKDETIVRYQRELKKAREVTKHIPKETLDKAWNGVVADFKKTCNKRKLRKTRDDEFEEEETNLLKPLEVSRGLENGDYIEEDESDFEYSDEPEIYGGGEVREFGDSVELENEDEVLVLDRSTKKQVLDIILKKGLEGKLSRLDVTKMQNRINRNVPLSKAMIDLIDDDELNGAVVEILEKGTTKALQNGQLLKAFEPHSEEEDSENEEFPKRRSRNNKKDRDSI